MKKLSIVLCSFMMMLASVFLVACGGGTTVTDVKANGIEGMYQLNEEIDLSNFKLDVTFSDKTQKTLTKFETDIEVKDAKADTEFVLLTDGLLDNERTAKDYSLTCKIIGYEGTYNVATVTVYENDNEAFDLDFFSEPTSLTTYKETVASAGDKEDENSFMTKSQEYVVGDDNEYILKPRVTLLKKTDSMPVEKNIKVDVKVTEGSQTVGDEVYTFNNTTYGFQFKADAIGRTFKITMKPTDWTTNKQGHPINAIEHTVTVQDGWNAYDASDLGRISMHDEEHVAGANTCRKNTSVAAVFTSPEGLKKEKYFNIWNKYFTDKGIEIKTINGIYLHNNIAVEESDLPEEYIISASENAYAAGTVRDYSYFYVHYMAKENEQFNINGNYFNIDLRGIEVCKSNIEDGHLRYYSENEANYDFGHNVLFAFAGYDAKKAGTTETKAYVNIENLSTIGNSGKNTTTTGTDEITPRSGSIIFVNSIHGITTTLKNSIIKECLLVATVEEGNKCIVIEDTKAFDCFSGALYAWGSTNNEIKNSILKRFGGAVILSVSAATPTGTKTAESSFTVDDNSVLESFVSGNQAWFALNGATTVVSQFTAADALFTPFKKTILQDGKFNLIFLALDDGYLAAKTPFLFSSLTLGDRTPYSSSELMGVAAQHSYKAIFQDNNGFGMAYGGTPDSIEMFGGAGYTGDKVYIHYPISQTASVGIVADLFSTEQAA